MQRFIQLIILLLLSSTSVYAQNDLSFRVKDSSSAQPIFGVKITRVGSRGGVISDSLGEGKLSGIPNGKQILKVYYIGFEEKEITINFPYSDGTPLEIFLNPVNIELGEIIVEATRANRTVANLPTRTEVLTEEIDEAASMEPSKISHLITHSTGIQVQTTSASSGGAVVRIQGLNGRYTQILKDGFPLYGGFSGSLDIMQIPPLDLKQVEYIKGSASTLYGGGAIGGIVNLISKRPENSEILLHENVSSIGARDFNAFLSKNLGKVGVTSFASLHMHRPYDADKDGYSDLADVVKIQFFPKIFFYPNKNTEISLGGSITDDTRMGGDMSLIANNNTDSSHYYFDSQTSDRLSTQLYARHTFKEFHTLKLKNSISSFNRTMQIRENAAGDITNFVGNQLNTFSELNYNLAKPTHSLNVGFNLYTDKFTEKEIDTSALRNQEVLTIGGYINYLWDISKAISLESGLRGDQAQAKSKLSSNPGEFFLIPRLSSLFKISRAISLRLGGGMGYRMPTIFNEDSEPYGYKNIEAIDYANVKAERSYGANFDFKYQSTFGSENVLLTLNQVFFYNLIDNPIYFQTDTMGIHRYLNDGEYLESNGFESQLKLTVWKFTLFVGYTYTDVFTQTDSTKAYSTLSPKHSIKGDLLFVDEGKWRIGWDFEYKSSQLLSTGLNSPSFFTTGLVIERRFKTMALFANAENISDVRQTRYGSINSGINGTPQFAEIWAPLDGFFFNWGMKIML